jgi:hypothetical protein
MFGRQWFGPASQVALEGEALDFESLVRKRKYSTALEFATKNIDRGTGGHAYGFWLRQRQRVLRLQQRNMTNNYISVAFRGFWPGFKEDDNEIFNILLSAAQIVGYGLTLDSKDPDLLIFSCFSEPCFEKFDRATRILYLGENVRPDFSATDYSLTFDMSDYCGRNIYLPLWLLRSTSFAAKTADYQPYKPPELEMPRPINQGDDRVVYIGNNTTPTRMEAINELKKHGVRVECYGSQTRPVSNKIRVLNQYRYSLCFENTYTPGYVTEKIIDSFLAGSIPIYWGGAPPEIFNLDNYFVCCPYQSIARNIDKFVNWKNHKRDVVMPPLLKLGAYRRSESLALSSLVKLFMDLF